MEPPKKNLLKLVPNIEEYEQTLKSHPYYEKTLKSVTDNRVVYVFKIPDEMILKVIKPFIRGKYSKIDQNYVDKNFAPIVTIGGMRVKDITYSILKREVWLKNYWEDRLDTELDKDAELASIIDPETETYWGGDTLSIAESRVI